MSQEEIKDIQRRETIVKEKIQKDLLQIEKTEQQIQRMIAKKKRLEDKVRKKSRREDAHEKIVIGGVVRSVLGRDFEEGDDRRLLYFLKMQERNGHYFTKAMNRRDQKENKKPDESV